MAPSLILLALAMVFWLLFALSTFAFAWAILGIGTTTGPTRRWWVVLAVLNGFGVIVTGCLFARLVMS